MRRFVVHAVLACLIASACLVIDLGPAAAVVGPGRVSVLHVASADSDVPVRDVWVYRPAVPDSRTLPVVYFLHGFPGSGDDLFAHGGKAVLDHMFATGTPPFVLAAPTGTGHAHADTEWADSVDGRDLVETYLIDRVIPAVASVFRHPSRTRVRAFTWFASVVLSRSRGTNARARRPARSLRAGLATDAPRRADRRDRWDKSQQIATTAGAGRPRCETKVSFPRVSGT